MRITKKEIYAKYDITFQDDKILSPIGWICELLKDGTTKTGKEVRTFSMLPTNKIFHVVINGEEMDIKGTCACTCEGCYATTGHYNHSITLQSLAINTYLVNNHIDFVKRAIMAQLETIGRGEIRIHAAGDFQTADPDAYAAMWHDVAAANPEFIFWTYTKVKRFENLFDDLQNANIVKSVIPHIGVNFGHCDYIINAYYTLKTLGESVYICECGINPDKHCAGCHVCAEYKYVLFLEHSTGYKAEKDPLYSKVVEIVKAQ